MSQLIFPSADILIEIFNSNTSAQEHHLPGINSTKINSLFAQAFANQNLTQFECGIGIGLIGAMLAHITNQDAFSASIIAINTNAANILSQFQGE